MIQIAPSTGPFQLHWSLHPLSYIAYRTHGPVEIDGDIEKAAWQAVPWSAPFRDITGSDSTIILKEKDANGTQTTVYKPALTQFKALYDDRYLYIAALLDPSPDFATVAHFTQHNSPIYQQDSDFEVFVDANDSTRDYKELEINAINTVWNLMLDKPYRNGGHEHSGRVAQEGEEDYYEVQDQTTATKIVSGRVNDEKIGAQWTVELKWSFRDLLKTSTKKERLKKERLVTTSSPPRPGSFYRINFSRVELQGQVNWTWQKQVIWQPLSRTFAGIVDMHLPDAWGYLVFGGDLQEKLQQQHSFRDALWPAKLAAMNVYYALEWYFQQHGEYTSQLEVLPIHADIVMVDGLEAYIQVLPCNEVQDGDPRPHYVVKVTMIETGSVVMVRDDRKMEVVDKAAYETAVK